MSCRSVKQVPKDYPGVQLIFGEGGGVTGQSTSYYLLENGLLFRSRGIVEAATEQYGRIPVGAAKRLIDNYHVLNLKNINFVHPGNRYFFVEWKDGGESHKITWGDPGFDVDQKVQLFYDLLNHEMTTSKNLAK